MKAIRIEQFGGPEVLKLVDVPVPAVGVGQVLVRVRAAGVNPVETYIRSGTHARKPPLPYTPGSDAGGSVESIGPDVSSLKVGDRVYTSGSISGTYAELALCDVADVHALPANVTYAQGAAVGIPYATAWRALMQRAQAQPGESVLVHGGSGAVGIAAVQVARALGLHVFATASTERGRKLALEQGAEDVFDHSASDHIEKIRERTGGRGPDIILEMLANANLAKDLSLIAPRGRVVVIGNRGTIEINPRDAMTREADIRGMLMFNATPTELARIHAAVIAGLENRTLRPIIARELPLTDAVEAHRLVMQSGAHGKIALLP